jgi:Arc/MetJ family transcription regulator
MRTNIDIDGELMTKAMHLSGHKTKKGTVEAALELLVRLKSQEAIRKARGKLRWEGDLEAMRRD